MNNFISEKKFKCDLKGLSHFEIYNKVLYINTRRKNIGLKPIEYIEGKPIELECPKIGDYAIVGEICKIEGKWETRLICEQNQSFIDFLEANKPYKCSHWLDTKDKDSHFLKRQSFYVLERLFDSECVECHQNEKNPKYKLLGCNSARNDDYFDFRNIMNLWDSILLLNNLPPRVYKHTTSYTSVDSLLKIIVSCQSTVVGTIRDYVLHNFEKDIKLNDIENDTLNKFKQYLLSKELKQHYKGLSVKLNNYIIHNSVQKREIECFVQVYILFEKHNSNKKQQDSLFVGDSGQHINCVAYCNSIVRIQNRNKYKYVFVIDGKYIEYITDIRLKCSHNCMVIANHTYNISFDIKFNISYEKNYNYSSVKNLNALISI